MMTLVLSGPCPSRIRVDGYKVFVRKARSRIDWGMNHEHFVGMGHPVPFAGAGSSGRC